MEYSEVGIDDVHQIQESQPFAVVLNEHSITILLSLAEKPQNGQTSALLEYFMNKFCNNE